MRALTDGMPSTPPKLWHQADQDAYVGLAMRTLWRISVDAPPVKITSASEPISAIVWPECSYLPRIEAPDPYAKYNQVAVSVEEGNDQRLYLVDLTSGHLTPLPKRLLGGQMEVESISPTSGAFLYASNGKDGLNLWLANRSATSPLRIFAANEFLQEVELGSYRRIEYTSLNGESLNGWVLLPPFYEPGKRYPLITWVYPTLTFGTSPPTAWQMFSLGAGREPSYNMEIPAARGYAILFPSIPMKPESELDDFMLKVTSGVLPAVDKVVALGIADPDRLFMMGKSWGGFGLTVWSRKQVASRRQLQGRLLWTFSAHTVNSVMTIGIRKTHTTNWRSAGRGSKKPCGSTLPLGRIWEDTCETVRFSMLTACKRRS